MDKEVSKENYDSEEKYSTEEFMGIYNQLNSENRKKVDQMIIKEYMEQVNKTKD